MTAVATGRRHNSTPDSIELGNLHNINQNRIRSNSILLLGWLFGLVITVLRTSTYSLAWLFYIEPG